MGPERRVRAFLLPMKETLASDRLRTDHRQIELHLDDLHDALKHLSPERVQSVRQSFRALQRLARLHMEQEERIFYPTLRSSAADLLAHMDRQHSDIRQTEHCLAELLDSFPAPPTERDFTELYRLGIEFHDAIQCHIVEEEDHLLKLADEQLSSLQQQHLLTEMQKLAEAAQKNPD